MRHFGVWQRSESRMAVKQTWQGCLCKSVANVFWHYSSSQILQRGTMNQCTRTCVFSFFFHKPIIITFRMIIRNLFIYTDFHVHYLSSFLPPPFFFTTFNLRRTKRTTISIQPDQSPRKFLPLFTIHLHYNKKKKLNNFTVANCPTISSFRLSHK